MERKPRCQHEVAGIIPGKGWGTIQCDGELGHAKVFRVHGTELYPIGDYDHANTTFRVHWNEDHENAIQPDMPAPDFGTVPTNTDPEAGPARAYVITEGNGGMVLAVADTKKACDAFLSVYNMNRHGESDRAVWTLTQRLVG